MRVVIVDDEPLAREFLRSLLITAGGVEIVGEAGSGPEAVLLIRNLQPDAAFLDVDMPLGDGISAASRLERSSRTQMVFVTAHDPYAVDAFDLGAADYLLKPVRRARLALTLERLRARLAALGPAPEPTPSSALPVLAPAPPPSGEPPCFWVKTRAGQVRLPVSEIIWVQAERDHVLFHTAGRSFLHRVTMEELGRKFAGSGLERVHRSAFVRVDAVRSISRKGKALLLHLPGDVCVPVGHAYRAALRQALTGAPPDLGD